MKKLSTGLFRVHTTPVVQAYDADNYSSEVRESANRAFFETALKTLKGVGNLWFVEPEGTRSNSGMKHAQPGVERVIINIDPLLLLVGVVPQEEFDTGFNKGLNVELVFLPSVKKADLNRMYRDHISLKDKLMYYLAQGLTPPLQGVYSSDLVDILK